MRWNPHSSLSNTVYSSRSITQKISSLYLFRLDQNNRKLNVFFARMEFFLFLHSDVFSTPINGQTYSNYVNSSHFQAGMYESRITKQFLRIKRPRIDFHFSSVERFTFLRQNSVALWVKMIREVSVPTFYNMILRFIWHGKETTKWKKLSQTISFR